jgi:hypothetical protein
LQPEQSGTLHIEYLHSADYDSGNGNVTLYDSTAGITILNSQGKSWSEDDLWVDYTHVYNMSADVFIGASSADWQTVLSGSEIINLSFTPVPEPATMCLLGLGGLLLRGKRSKT